MINPHLELQSLTSMCKGTIVEFLGIEYIEFGSDYITARMPVDNRTIQPLGLLHGGASVVLAETLGGVSANSCIDTEKQYCVGLEINANHLKVAHKGYVYGTSKPIHLGKKTHVWEIRITDEDDQLICISRMTLAILDKINHG
jgi:1,4-dihydroxy-2-naphthoyl-CoA hydrolase